MRNRMPDGDEFAQGATADSLSGGFRGHELRKGRFEFDEFLIKPVVFPVRNGGVRQNVIGVVVPSDLFGKLPVFSFSVLDIHALASNRAAERGTVIERVARSSRAHVIVFASCEPEREKKQVGTQTATSWRANSRHPDRK